MAGSVAVFVDGDNLSASHANAIHRHANAFGSVMLAKSYGNDASLTCWQKSPEFQFVYSGQDKNATDVLLAIEATEYVIANDVQTVCLCSSDADFTHLARFIRARGTFVLGMGEEKTNTRMRQACSEFRVLGMPDCGKLHRPVVSDLDWKIKSVIAKFGFEKGGMKVADLNVVMSRQHKVLISQTPDKNWRSYLSNRAALYELGPRGPDARVRFKKDAFVS